MKKAWALLWFVVVAVFAISIIAAVIKPWIPAIAAVIVVVFLVAVAVFIWRRFAERRRFF
ncbi:hypothetical protein [Curtobacterium sp. MCSS17_007]|uniref:hypothetical protein n=1 Tax=Curtobacterium sp. MCSS17_007 TaxID=2175646 RepID=UPI000DA9917F|nr:hypothetical protein [Curtobacterium sp. MCSS17_007]WIE74467.1 hypothetical protein DEJ22_009245 [Curtobacterium sp. MCSS17_007]